MGGTPKVSGSGTASQPGLIAGELPGDPKTGLPPAYTKYPCNPFKSVNGVPGEGGPLKKVTTFQISYSPPPKSKGDNPYWQELEKRLGVTWDPTLTPQPEYGTKSAALIAGGDMPDLYYINPGQGAAAQYEAIFQGAFTDLTSYLQGEALKEYPNLARFPTIVWEQVQLRGKIYGVPRPIPPIGDTVFYRHDWLPKIGVKALNNSDDIFNYLVGCSKKDPDGNGKANTYGVSGYGGYFEETMFNRVFGVPNGWRVEKDGKLVNQVETDEFKDTLAFMRKLWDAGAYDPESATINFSEAVTSFWRAGTLGALDGGYQPAFGTGTGREGQKQYIPKADSLPMVAPGPNGGKGYQYLSVPFFGFMGIPSKLGQDPANVKQLLKILNYMAAPFGSEEFTFVNYGIKDRDYKLDANCTPTPTDAAQTDLGGINYLVDPTENSFFYPGKNGAAEAKLAYEYGKKLLEIGIADPTATLYSKTGGSAGATLNQLGQDYTLGIVTGRKPLSALDQWIKDWRSRGGDKIRQEYQEELSKSK